MTDPVAEDPQILMIQETRMMRGRHAKLALLATLASGLIAHEASGQEHGGAAPQAPEHPDAAAITAAVDAYHTALSAGQGDVALSLLADDAVVLESGGLESRAEYADHHLPGDMAFAAAVTRTRGEVHVAGHGDVAWAWSTSETKGTFRDREIDSVGAELMVLVRTDGVWKITAIHWSSRRR